MNDCKVKFSIGKMLIVILCSVIVSVFIGSTYMFVTGFGAYVQNDVMSLLKPGSNEMIEIGKTFEPGVENLKLSIEEEKINYGEDYPAEGILMFKLITMNMTSMVGIYLSMTILGVAIGIVIYIVMVQNAKGKKLILELVAAGLLLLILIYAMNFIYQIILNNIINNNAIEYQVELYDMNFNEIMVAYLSSILVALIINFICQVVKVTKLNKELVKNK